MPKDIVFAKLPGLVFNALVVVAFVLGLFCYSMPGLHIVLTLNIVNVLLAPLYFLAFIHVMGLMGLAGLIGWLSNLGRTGLSITYITAILLPCRLWVQLNSFHFSAH